MNKALLIAELSANHGHNISIAKETIKAAKESGADAVKFQTYTPDTMTIDCDNEFFRINQGTIWDGTTLYDLYREAHTPWEWHYELFEYARKIGIKVFSTPFDRTSVDFLESLDTPVYKIASFEITDIPLIKYVASKKKPIIISVGIATLKEIEEAVEACRLHGNDDITLLQCISQYPAQPEDSNLLTMLDMKDRFNVKVGLSDHTLGYETANTAVAMGARVIEKHFIINRSIGGPDASFSMTPDEFLNMVDKIRFTEKIMGSVTYDITKEKDSSRAFARSLFVIEDVKAGDTITDQNVRSIRPGYGISPKYINELIGHKYSSNVKRGTPFSWEMLDRSDDEKDKWTK